MTLSQEHLNRATLARQMLLEREAKAAPAEVVRRLCGMQAQEPRHPFLGLWTRMEGFEREDLHRALHGRDVVRGTLMRGTLHLATPDSYVAMRPALQPVLAKGMRALGDRARGLELDRVLRAARKLLRKKPHTFTELRAELQEEFPDVHERALGFAVRMNLPLLMVPTEARWGFPRDAQFTLAEQWVGRHLAGGNDPSALVRDYLAAFGPATAADVQTFTGLGAMKTVLKKMGDEVEVLEDDKGRELFDLPGAPRPDPDVPAPPRFLPEFDSLMLAHSDRTRLLPDEHKRKVVTKNLRVRATFLWQGAVAGTWRIERKKKSATLELAPFAELSKRAQKELAGEGEGVVRFAEEDAESFEVKWVAGP